MLSPNVTVFSLVVLVGSFSKVIQGQDVEFFRHENVWKYDGLGSIITSVKLKTNLSNSILSENRLVTFTVESKYSKASQFETFCVASLKGRCTRTSNDKCYCIDTVVKNDYDLMISLAENCVDFMYSVRSYLTYENGSKLHTEEQNFKSIYGLRRNFTINGLEYFEGFDERPIFINGSSVELMYTLVGNSRLSMLELQVLNNSIKNTSIYWAHECKDSQEMNLLIMLRYFICQEVAEEKKLHIILSCASQQADSSNLDLTLYLAIGIVVVVCIFLFGLFIKRQKIKTNLMSWIERFQCEKQEEPSNGPSSSLIH